MFDEPEDGDGKPAAAETDLLEEDPPAEEADEFGDPEEEPDPEDEPEEGDPPAVAATPRKKTASDTIRDLKRELKEIRATVERRPEPQAPVDPAAAERARREADAEENERLALMTPEERTDYRLRKQELKFEERFSALARNQGNDSDRSTFRALCASDSLMASVADDVEKRCEEMIAKGQYIRREVIANLILGERLRERAKTGGKKQRKAADGRVSRETVRPGGGRSDAQRGKDRGKDKDADIESITF